MNGRSALACIFIIALGISASAQTAIEYVNGRPAAANEVIVRLKPGASISGILADADAKDLKPAKQVLKIASKSQSASKLIERLSKRGDVQYAEPNYLIQLDSTVPNDPSFGQTWGLKNSGQVIQGVLGKSGADISATLAWDLSTGNTQQVVGVVDTGVDYTHPDLAANIWTAPADFTVTINGIPITCPAGSHGFNAITLSCDPMDDNSHGTHCSGTIGAAGNNSQGVAGVNWNARIMGLKFLDAGGSGYLFDAINAIDFAVQAKAIFGGAGGAADVRVLSNSWGCQGCFSQALLDEINVAGVNNMLFVAAAGNNATNNDFSPFYPANFVASNLISVAATDNQDNLAWFSNYGAATVHLAAPGVDVLSTVPGGGYAYFSGTSMATPHVAGSSLLALSLCDATTTALRTAILNNTDGKTQLTGKVQKNGRLNVNKAIRSCSFNISTTSVSFGNQGLGSPSAEKQATVANNRASPVTVNSISTGGDFAVTSTTCPAVMAAKTSCKVNMTFTPSALGARIGTLTVLTNAPGSPHTAPLTGAGVNGLTASTGSLGFGNVLVGASSTAKTVTITNNRSNLLNITSTLSGDYQIQSTNCGATLAAKTTCQFTLVFMPTTGGSRPGTLSVDYDATGSPLKVALSGIGLAPVSVTPVSIAFAARAVGSTSPSSIITIKNNLAVLLNFAGTTVSGDFAQTATSCGASLSPALSCTVSVVFKPTVGGLRTGSFTVFHDGPGGMNAVSLTGTGTLPVVFNSTAGAFSNTIVGTLSASKTFTLTNKQSIPLTFSSIATTGDFTQTNTCGSVLAALSSCTITVRFAPTALGLLTGSLAVADDASNSPQTIALSGTGI